MHAIRQQQCVRVWCRLLHCWLSQASIRCGNRVPLVSWTQCRLAGERVPGERVFGISVRSLAGICVSLFAADPHLSLTTFLFRSPALHTHTCLLGTTFPPTITTTTNVESRVEERRRRLLLLLLVPEPSWTQTRSLSHTERVHVHFSFTSFAISRFRVKRLFSDSVIAVASKYAEKEEEDQLCAGVGECGNGKVRQGQMRDQSGRS